jgi:hypothetical protein
MNPYDYANRSGILPISWEDFHGLCKALARAAVCLQPEVILPIGRGGYYPGTLLAHLLQCEVHPVRLSRRLRDVVTYATPEWLVEPPAAIAGKRVLIVDEISSTGETLRLAREKAQAMGAALVKSAVLYAHRRGAEAADFIGLITDDLVLNPWDREILSEGSFVFHPEYRAALQAQGCAATPELLIPAREYHLAKGETLLD